MIGTPDVGEMSQQRESTALGEGLELCYYHPCQETHN